MPVALVKAIIAVMKHCNQSKLGWEGFIWIMLTVRH